MGIQFEEVTYRYGDTKTLSNLGLDHFDMELQEGRFIAVLGASGSGKSTMLQHLNALLLPSEGTVTVLDYKLMPAAPVNKKKRSKQPKAPVGLRRRVGLVFQFPEQQLFEQTIEKDLRFGPKNFGATEEEAEIAALHAAQAMGLDEELLGRSPFEVSGGQMRKAAVAAVLAADPDIIVLDEPTASLDQYSRDELMRLLHRLYQEEGKTIIIVTHRLEEVLPYAEEYVIMNNGRNIYQGDAQSVLQTPDVLASAGIALPPSMVLIKELMDRYGAEPLSTYPNPEILASWIKKTLAR